MRLLLMSGLIVSLVACDDKGSNNNDTANGAIDEDGDGFAVGDDCDDADAAVNPDAEEICDEIDNNCDGDIDAGLGLTIYSDNDGDGYGNAGSSATSCEIPDGYAADGGDCDDADSDVYPGAPEYCNGLDEDCDDIADNDALDARAYYVDSDGDDVGDSSTEVVSCVRPSGYVEVAGDCDDTNDDIFPGNSEACDGIDNDCDKTTTDLNSVSFADRGGSITDLTEIFNSGTSSYPARYYVERPGSITFCGGSWKGALIIDADVEIYGQGGSTDNVLDAGEQFHSIVVESGARNIYIEGMTFRRGVANTAGLDTYRRSGGGIYCNTGASIELEDVTIKEAEAEAGGAIYSSGCPITMSNSTLTENNAVFGGAVAIDSGTFSMTDSIISGNTGNYYAGGVYLYSRNGNVTFNMTDSFIEDNTATYYGGVYIYRYYGSYNATMTCTATTDGAGGIIGNSDTYYGGMYLYMYYGGSFKSDNCDFGESGSSNDNTPNDIYQYSSAGSGYYSYGDSASFTCSNSQTCN
ncbi:MAG: hypothetical protein ACI8S6_000263 [Myxococcota bacterium]|jgi:hypothetical protein